MIYERDTKTLKQFVRWINRKGAKYPLPGCPVNYEDITNAAKAACKVMESVVDACDFSVLIRYAEAGARSLALKPECVVAIKKANRALRRMSTCQDTESQPTIQHA